MSPSNSILSFGPEYNESAIDCHLKFFLCILTSIRFIKVVRIHNGDLKESDSYMDSVLRKIHGKFEVPLTLETFQMDFEQKVYENNDRISNEGKLLQLRTKQKRVSILVEDKTLEIPDGRYNSKSDFGVIVVVTKLDHLDKYLKGTARPPFIQPNGLYAIVVFEKVDLTETVKKMILNSVLERLWRFYGILKAGLTFYSSGNEYFYFNPFDSRRGNVNPKDTFSKWGRTIRADLENSSTFCNRSLANLYTSFGGYPLRSDDLKIESWKQFVSKDTQRTLDRTNIKEAFLLMPKVIARILSQKMNFKLIGSSQIAASPQKQSDSKVSSGLSSLRVNLTIKETPKGLELLYPLSLERVCIMTPKAAVVPRFLVFLLCYAPSTWLLIVTSHFLLIFCFVCIRRFYQGRGFSATALFHDTVEAYSSEDVFSPRRTLRAAPRIVLMAFLFYILTLDGIYEGFLSTWFSTTTYFKDFQTLKEVDQSGCPLYTFSSTLQKFLFAANDSDPVIRSLSSKMRFTNDLISLLNRTASGENNCFVVFEKDFDVFTELFPTELGTLPFNLVPECPQALYTTFVTHENWALGDRFNSVLGNLNAAGLLEYWKRRILDYLNMKSKMQKRKQPYDPRKPIKINDLQIPFYFLAIGLTLSFCIFALERLYYKLRGRNKNRVLFSVRGRRRLFVARMRRKVHPYPIIE